MQKRRTGLTVHRLSVVMLVILLGGIGVTTAPAATRTLTWLFPINTATGGFYPFYAARDLGFWEEEGLKVEFKGAGGSGAAIQLLIAGHVDAGIPSMPATLNALSKGQKLRAFYQYSTGTIFFLKVPKAGPVQSVQDLKGKVIGISEPGGGEVPMIKAALKGAGLNPDKDVRLIPIGEGSPATFDAIKSGRVDAYSSNFTDTLSVELAGIPLRDITPPEFDAFPAQMMLATPDNLDKHREALISLARGVAKATWWCQNKPADCETLLKNAAKEQWADPRVGQALYQRSLQITAPRPGQRFGEPAQEALAKYLAFVKEQDPEFNTPDIDAFLVTELLDEINRFDRDAVLQVQYKP
ncbi:MAG TPA: ABC transporter substrate-binding protein [Candidatus Entotheonella sp.]